MVIMMTTMMKKSPFFYWMNTAISNFAAFSLAEMNWMATWNR